MSTGTNVGNVVVGVKQTALVSGAAANGEVGNVQVFGQVIPDQEPAFENPDGVQPGDPLSSPVYQDPEGVAPGQPLSTPNFDDPVPGITPGQPLSSPVYTNPGGFAPGGPLSNPGWKDVA